MKILKISLILLILSIGISCDKDEEPTNALAQDLQNGFWESDDDEVLRFDGTNVAFNLICFEEVCGINFPCVVLTLDYGYTLEGNTITTTDGDTFPIKIEGDILTIDNSFEYQRKDTLGYPVCE